MIRDIEEVIKDINIKIKENTESCDGITKDGTICNNPAVISGKCIIHIKGRLI